MKSIRYLIFPLAYVVWGVLLFNISGLNPSLHSLLQGGGLMILGIYLFRQDLKEAWMEFKNLPSIWTSIIKTSLGLFLFNMVARGILVALFINYIDLESLGQNQQVLEETLPKVSPLIFAFSITIAAPFNEELIFRHSFNHWVPKNQPLLKWTMSIISTVLFASGHVFMWQDFILYLPLAISIYWIYAKYHYNIWASIIFHFFNNALALIMMYLFV